MKRSTALNEKLCKRRQMLNAKTLIVTVDFGKVKNSGYCRCPDGTELPCFEFHNEGQGFKKFWSRINWMQQKHDLTEVVVGFESTGPYGEPLMHFLHKREVRLVQVNPAHTKRIKEVYDNSPNKTDDKDPKVIADLLELGRFLSVVIPEGTAAELRRLSHARERATKRRKALYNQLHDLVFLIFPEFLQVMHKLYSKTAHYLLKNYAAPGEILCLGVNKLGEIFHKVSRGKLRKERAESLYFGAKGSVGLREAQSSMVFEIREVLNLIDSCDKFIKEIEAKLNDFLTEIPYSRYILSIKGFGVVTVAGLIGELGDFNNFKTIDELMKFAGLNLYELSSGEHQGQRRISKRGRPLIRKLLYFAALSAVRKGGVMHLRYQKYLQRGMPKLKALTAISRKLLVIIFALVRDHQEYIVDYSNTPPLLRAA